MNYFFISASIIKIIVFKKIPQDGKPTEFANYIVNKFHVLDYHLSFLFERQQKSETVFPLRTSAYWKDKKEIILIMQPLNLPHRTGVGVGPGEPVEELLDILFPAAPFMAVILFKVGRDLNAVVRKEFGKRLRPVGAVL